MCFLFTYMLINLLLLKELNDVNQACTCSNFFMRIFARTKYLNDVHFISKHVCFLDFLHMLKGFYPGA